MYTNHSTWGNGVAVCVYTPTTAKGFGMVQEMNKYSQTKDLSSPSEDSGCAEVTGCSSEDFSRTSFDRSIRNPFYISYVDRLRYPLCSPSLFKSTGKTRADVNRETGISSLISCDFDESESVIFDETLDPETEKAAQEAISKFFEDESKDLFVTPDKVVNSFLLNPEEERNDDDISLPYTCDPSTLQHDINLSTTWAQTNITFPPNLPEEVEAALASYRKQDENELLKLATCRVCDTECGRHSQGTQTDDQEMNLRSVKTLESSSQTVLSLSKRLPEAMEALLSTYETFIEEICTDIRMSMMKRQLFSEHCASSPQLHSSSPLSMLNDTSPPQSGSSFTPQCAAVRLRHHGSPMGDILSPTGVSPIARPSRANRFLSKLDFVNCQFERASSMSPPAFLRLKGSVFPMSEEDENSQRN
ncbi:uncharacterized protein LOC126248226 isoform X1 [Schistocerca nitens]|uniref:uncharacterized protein LOC126248226 isoform X1 n=2 Tax=Schistocerca nitens TaxID=7011 RepID=UPI002117E2FA|nr:uncharacterized protein LOC126248226 isoform X1 [Schistocerca nitens]XP_049805007.1 uncharacterized protein LOC126248226 isoform X1 [Schistocerca nitens]XP_049805008.1 uncharacterized protein LOC126248226 isoform X1 [Schistocerca nitens]